MFLIGLLLILLCIHPHLGGTNGHRWGVSSDVKHNGRHKARIVADGYLTVTPAESVYSGVVSLRRLRMCLFIGELDGMIPWAIDIDNAYLETNGECMHSCKTRVWKTRRPSLDP